VRPRTPCSVGRIANPSCGSAAGSACQICPRGHPFVLLPAAAALYPDRIASPPQPSPNFRTHPSMPAINCRNCGLVVQVPEGCRRLCGCGAWLSGDDVPEAEEVALAEEAESWPRIEGDLSAIERLNNGYQRVRRELSKVIVGQERVLEELLIAIFARG